MMHCFSLRFPINKEDNHTRSINKGCCKGYAIHIYFSNKNFLYQRFFFVQDGGIRKQGRSMRIISQTQQYKIKTATGISEVIAKSLLIVARSILRSQRSIYFINLIT